MCEVAGYVVHGTLGFHACAITDMFTQLGMQPATHSKGFTSRDKDATISYCVLKRKKKQNILP